MGLSPEGHLMEELRETLGKRFLTARQLEDSGEGETVLTGGLVQRLQHPAAQAYFITLEDETGLIPLILWLGVYEQYRSKIRESFLLVKGKVSRKQGTLNIVVEHMGSLRDFYAKQEATKATKGTETLKKARPYFR